MSKTVSAEALADILEDVLRREMGHGGYVPLHSPALEGAEWTYLKECLDSGWVSSAGSFVDRLEQAVAVACGVSFGIATVNGTAALHAALAALGAGPDSAVIVPALSFIATANAVTYCGAAPIFADISPDTLGLDPAGLERFLAEDCETRGGVPVHGASGRALSAVVPVHIFGHPADMDAIASVCEPYGLPVVEDAAEALGSRIGDRPCGSLGAVGVISFNGNKIVTGGGGGMLLTDDAGLAGRLKHLTTTARRSDDFAFDHDMVGFNYRMPSINAALALAQLEQLDGFVARKRRLAKRYGEAFSKLDGVSLLREAEGRHGNNWLNTLLFDDAAAIPEFIKVCEARGVMTRPAWRLLPDTGAYSKAATTDDLKTARDIAPRLVNIPSSAWLMPDSHD